jgi:hypothetical protein
VAWWVLATLLIAPWVVLVWVLNRPKIEPLPPSAAKHATTAPSANGFTHHCQPGAWGELEYSRIVIEPPEEFVTANYPEPKEIRWRFKGYSPEKLAELWREAGLDAAQLRVVGDPSARTTTLDGIDLRLGKEFVLGLNSAARTRIYTALAAFPENPAQAEPFRFRADVADEWFDHSGLSPATIAFVERLLYRRGTSLIFSDYDIVLPMLATPEERTRLVKTLSRKSTLLVKLTVKPDSDIEALGRYWGRGLRSKDVKPLLQSVGRRPQGLSIDIAHLLPSFARSLLYTYPLPSDNPVEFNRDCYWTALNFFKPVPDDRFSNIDFVKRTLLTEYYPAPGDPVLGDVLIFTKPDGAAVHACVYVADDIVFTKNGTSFAMPWILMTLDDVRAFYPADLPLEIRRYRAKNY